MDLFQLNMGFVRLGCWGVRGLNRALLAAGLRLVLLLVFLEVGCQRDVLLAGLKGVHCSFNE